MCIVTVVTKKFAMPYSYLNKKQLLLLLGIVLLVLVVGATAYYIRIVAQDRAHNEAVKTLFSDDAAATYLDAQSNEISLSQYEGQILVVNVWASWSPYTEIEFPILDEIASRYKDKGVRVLAMNRKETQPQIERYLASIPTYNTIERITDVNDFFYAGIDGYAMPETVIYDSKGKIIEHIRGVVTKEQLENTLDGIINE